MIRNLIQRAETQTRLTRALLIKERVAAPTLATEVSPVIVVDDLSRETDFNLGTTRKAYGWSSAGPVAGQYSLCALGSPVASGGLILLTRLRLFSTAATAVRLGIMPFPAWSSTTGKGFRDTRVPGTPIGEPLFIQQVAASFINPIQLKIESVSLYEILDLNILISPGFAFVVEQETVNRTLVANFFWDEQYIDK